MKNKRTVEWLNPDVYANDYQFYRQWATNAWSNSGGVVKKGFHVPFSLKKIASKANFLARAIPVNIKSGKALIVCCGAFPTYSAWPYLFYNEIIPIIWDCWPKYHKRMIESLKDGKVQTVFFTSSQLRDMVKEQIPGINAFWLPEGIDVLAYKSGDVLSSRTIDILELGRQYIPFHRALINSERYDKINHLYSKSGELLFKDFDSLTDGLANAKITICYPRCDTHPEMAGNIETLTQRYWECMLSGTIIVGRAPKELINFCGYNPVVEIEDNNINAVFDILDNISNYQDLCDRNRCFALENATWDSRISVLNDHLKKLGYNVKSCVTTHIHTSQDVTSFE